MSLHPGALVEEAQQRTGLSEFDSQSFWDGLSVLLSEVDRCDRVTEQGRAAMTERVVSSLARRLRVADYAHQHPEVGEERIDRPVFVLGAPRTGTTLASNLLAVDPARRSLLSWLLVDPIPPPTLDTLTTDPRCLAMLEMEQLGAGDPTFEAFRRLYRYSAVYPMECGGLMMDDFKTLAWEAMFPSPGYSDFAMNSNTGTAYSYHKLVLQVLQSKAPGTWNLKLPSHAVHARWLIDCYPDARIVWCHRDPFMAMGSLMSLIAVMYSQTGNDADDQYIGRHYPAQIAAHVDRMTDFMRARPDVPIHHLHYADMMRDPVGEMKRLYAFLGDDLTPEAEAAMRGWLADNPQGKYGQHSYTLDRFGHSEVTLRPHFESYLAHFEVEREGS